MKIGKKLFSLLGTALLATAVAWNFGGATEVQETVPSVMFRAMWEMLSIFRFTSKVHRN